MVIKKNENLYMQIWNDFPKYILTWKKCVVCSCESMWGGMCSGVSRGEEEKQTWNFWKKHSSGTASKEEYRGLVQKENTLHWILYCMFSTKEHPKPRTPIYLCWARNYNIHKYQMNAKGKIHDKWLVHLFILFK